MEYQSISKQNQGSTVSESGGQVTNAQSLLGGGICLYARESLRSNETSTTTAKNAYAEDIWVTVQSSKLLSFIADAACRLMVNKA